MPYKRLRYKCYDLQCHKARRTMTSIVPYKSFVGLRQSIYVSPPARWGSGDTANPQHPLLHLKFLIAHF